MSQKVRSVTIRLPQKMYDQINSIANQQGETISDTIRHLIDQGLTERLNDTNAELIAKVVRSEVEYALKAYAAAQLSDGTQFAEKLTDGIFEERIVLYRTKEKV